MTKLEMQQQSKSITSMVGHMKANSKKSFLTMKLDTYIERNNVFVVWHDLKVEKKNEAKINNLKGTRDLGMVMEVEFKESENTSKTIIESFHFSHG
jgi:hypothetical protein